MGVRERTMADDLWLGNVYRMVFYSSHYFSVYLKISMKNK